MGEQGQERFNWQDHRYSSGKDDKVGRRRCTDVGDSVRSKAAV